MTRTADLLYGAFELKSRYQRNMMMGILTAGLLAMAVMGSVWVYSVYFMPKAIPIPPPPPRGGIVDTIIFIPPPGPPTDPEYLPGQGKKVLPPPPSEFSGGIIEIIDDNSTEQERGIIPPAPDGVYGDFDPTKEYGPDGNYGSGSTGKGSVYIPDPKEFIPFEIGPELVNEVLPVYPHIAQEAGFTAWVRIQAFVDKSGDVIKAEAVRCNRPKMGFEEAAIEAALKCKYRPAIQNGDPIGIWIAYKVEFKF